MHRRLPYNDVTPTFIALQHLEANGPVHRPRVDERAFALHYTVLAPATRQARSTKEIKETTGGR
jgi:hypothetical protein